MGRLIKLHEIDEFSDVKNIPDAAITKEILSNVKQFDEVNVIEKSIREIIYDPNNTPHGPSEIADILTSHINVRGSKCMAAYIIKGKSFDKVKSITVAHQFLKIRQIPGIGLLVFIAVGDIQDDAQRDFIQVAFDTDCDYIIIDAQDLARLLICYEKICPKDGTPFIQDGKCEKGHLLHAGLTLELEVNEKLQYSIYRLNDISHYGAKRYSAILLVDRHYNKELLREVVFNATLKIKKRNYYRNDKLKNHWGDEEAHVVWINIAFDLDDIINTNWVCHTSWISQKLDQSMKPLPLKCDEKFKDIDIQWNDTYKSRKEFFSRHIGTKEDIIEKSEQLVNELSALAVHAIYLFNQYKNGELEEGAFIPKMQSLSTLIDEVHDKTMNIPSAPEECKDFDLVCQGLFGTIHDMSLYYSERGLKTWQEKNNRDWLMKDTIRRFLEDYKKYQFESNKIHKT